MCKYCNEKSTLRCVFQDMVGDWYLDVETAEWDDYDDEYVHQKVYISYCPFCGRKLGNEEEMDKEVECVNQDELKLDDKEIIDYLKSTGLYDEDDDFCYEKELLEPDRYVSVSELVKRFVGISKVYEGDPFNICQIIQQIYMIPNYSLQEDEYED